MAVKRTRKISGRSKRYGKSYRIKKKKSGTILKNKFFWLFISVFILFGGIFYFASFSRFFQVDGSEIQGNGKVSSESLEVILKNEVEKKILFFPTKSIFFANLNEAKEKIEKEFPQIAKVKIKRDFPNKISIQIVEKQPVAVFCRDEQSEKCFLVDEEGIIIDYVILINSENLKLPKIIGDEPRAKRGASEDENEVFIADRGEGSDLGSKVINKDYLAQVLEIYRKINESQQFEIKEFIPSARKLTVTASDGWQAFFDPRGEVSDQIFNMLVLLKEKFPRENRRNLDYIDLRFSKIYFKYRAPSENEGRGGR